ncbi:MAG: D-alanyl-D-alanine carboxypeptidase family protein [Chlamydiales bacterium]|nr:D-alanyl-D-alanine carboxypeptidase family protein [Chlamydiales bacterium]
MVLIRILFALIVFAQPILAEPLQINVEAEAAILINADTGAVLYEKNSRDRNFPASTTKVATAIYTLEKSGAKLDSLAVADQECVGFVTESAKKRSNYSLPSHYLEFGATHMVIHKGEKLSLRDLLYGTMVHSADDASNVVAQHVGGTIPKFMEELNKYVKEVGCQDTHFMNPHGLHHPEHYTTAYDMAVLSAHALKNRQFREIVATTQWTRPKTEFQQAMTLVQTNRLLRKGDYYYPKAIGVKTGFTGAAQSTIVAAAQHNGRTLVAVLLKNKDRKEMFKDAIKLFEAAFNQPMLERTILPAGSLPYSTKVANSGRTVQGSLAEPLTVEYYPAETPELKATLKWHEVALPVAQGQEIGLVMIEDGHGRLVKSATILAAHEVKISPFNRLWGALTGFGFAAWATVLGFICVTTWFLKRR